MDTIYEALGGETQVRLLVDTFYDVMDAADETAGVRAMHPKSLKSSREKLFLFLTGWTGGPQLYIEKYGHPRLRARHLPFPIGDDQAIAWIACMREALAKVVQDETLREQLETSLTGVAAHMRNQAD
ncbi:MAG: hemoglobin [Planctomycetota bacterium]|jgi:hemoglobin